MQHDTRRTILVIAASLALTAHASRAQVGDADTADYGSLVARVVQRGIQAGGFPGAAVAFGTADSVLLARGFGHEAWDGSAVSASLTRYDLASLTKVVATTSAIMVLVDDGRVGLDDRIARHLPEFRGEGRDRITIRDVLLHRAGLPAAPNLRGATNPSAAKRAVLRTSLAVEPRTRTVYSDAGPIILGLLVERVTGESVDVFVGRRIFSPLGMRSTGFRPAADVRTAPTAADADGVHDPNARRLGGIAGHAGLFSTVADLSVFARLMLGGGEIDGVRIFRETTVARFTARQEGGRSLGWDSCAGGGRCGLRMSPSAYGHTGFTGTSLWIDPELGVFVIVLSNAVLSPHAYDPSAVLADVRADIADLAVCAASGQLARPPRLRAEIGVNWFHAGAAPAILSNE